MLYSLADVCCVFIVVVVCGCTLLCLGVGMCVLFVGVLFVLVRVDVRCCGMCVLMPLFVVVR